MIKNQTPQKHKHEVQMDLTGRPEGRLNPSQIDQELSWTLPWTPVGVQLSPRCSQEPQNAVTRREVVNPFG